MNTVNDSNTFDPARYAAQLAQSIDSLHRHLEAEQPEWWQQVLIELHDQLAEIYLADVKSGGRYKTQLENRAALMAMPKAATATGAPWNTQPPPWKQQASQAESGFDVKEMLAQFKAEHPEGNYAGRLFDDRPEQHNAAALRTVYAVINAVAGSFKVEIDRLTARLESLSAAHESLHNTCWKQSYDIGSRLEALEMKTPS